MNIKTKVDVFPLKKLFTISRGSRTEAEVVSVKVSKDGFTGYGECCLLYTSPSPRDGLLSRMPSSA